MARRKFLGDSGESEQEEAWESAGRGQGESWGGRALAGH